LRQDRKALEGSAAGFQEATRLAEAALVRLRAATELAGRQVAERVAAAEPLRDDLRYLAERAEGIADRLDMLVRSARPLAAEPVRLAGGNPSPPPTSDRADQSIGSQAERDLLHALRRQR